MPSLPDGETPPEDGLLPETAAHGSDERTLSLYVHVPFCSVRCGYCDFNTYTALELGPDVSQAAYHLEAVREIEFAREALERSGAARRELHTVFFGGGTPTRLASSALGEILDSARGSFGLLEGAEVTTEANPDSVTREDLQTLADGGFTRVSFGVQSAVPHVLRTLERTHDPANVPRVVQWAKEAGLSVSTDLIYGTPGESPEDWRESLRQAISLEPDHLSAYSLIVEDGTRMAAQMRRGDVDPVDPDDQAEKYGIAEQMLSEAGFEWYEISNWSRVAGGRSALENRSAHNLAYWHNQDWWGVGPGAHSHVGSVRWWNRKHPMPYAQTVRRGLSPAVGREQLDDDTRYMERVMLESRIADGMPLTALRPEGREQIAGLVAEELIDGRSALQGRLVLTLRGRLLGDAVVRRLLVD